jgi:hypothetical protein
MQCKYRIWPCFSNGPVDYFHGAAAAFTYHLKRIKIRSGEKRAIVAIARTLLLRLRRMLLDKQAYVPDLAA